MKKPDEKKKSADAKSRPDDASAESGKKPAAKPGTVTAKDVGAGDGKAAASGAKIKPADSVLVGDAKDGKAAAPKDDAAPEADKARPAEAAAGQSPVPKVAAAAKPAEVKSAETAKPAETAKAAEPKADPKAASGQAAKSDTAKSDTGKPADQGQKDPLKDAPAEAILRETPASAPAPTQNVTVQKTGFWPVALGGLVAAGIGAAAMMWAMPQQTVPEPAPAPTIDVDAIRADAVSAAEAAARAEVDALRAELAAAALPEAPPATEPEPAEPAAPAEPVAVPDSATADQVAALQSRLEEQAARIDELAARPVIDPDVAQRVQSLADQAGALEQQIQAAAENAQSEITAAQAEAQKLQEAAEESTRRAAAVAAVASLQSALDRGVTPEEARQTLEGVGIDTPAPLTQEVPSLDSLQTGFGDAARAALRASLRDESSGGGGNVLTNFLKAQTGVRSVEAREGDDPDAILSRANAEVQTGQIAAALDELAGLPEGARAAPAMADWLAGATLYRDAQAALADLSANSN